MKKLSLKTAKDSLSRREMKNIKGGGADAQGRTCDKYNPNCTMQGSDYRNYIVINGVGHCCSH